MTSATGKKGKGAKAADLTAGANNATAATGGKKGKGAQAADATASAQNATDAATGKKGKVGLPMHGCPESYLTNIIGFSS